jgi:hypothetical protein
MAMQANLGDELMMVLFDGPYTALLILPNNHEKRLFRLVIGVLGDALDLGGRRSAPSTP